LNGHTLYNGFTIDRIRAAVFRRIQHDRKVGFDLPEAGARLDERFQPARQLHLAPPKAGLRLEVRKGAWRWKTRKEWLPPAFPPTDGHHQPVCHWLTN